jgi:hypothetical protein
MPAGVLRNEMEKPVSLKGISHIHTTFSFDGKVEIEKLHEFFAGHGFDFVLMSEHIETLDLARMQEIYDACERVSTSECVFIPGIEIDDLHILIFGIARPERYDDIESFTQDCHARGSLVVLSHPVKIRKGIPPVVLPLLAGVELWNTRYDGRQAPRPANHDLLRELRKNAPGLVAMCGMDFHNYSDFSPISLELEAASREPRAILDAIRRGGARICSHGAAIPIYDDSPALAMLAHRVRGRIATVLYDGAVGCYRGLKRLGFRVPRPIRRGVKGIL